MLALTATTLAACSNSEGPTDTTIPNAAALAKADGPVTVTLWHGLGDAAGVALQKAIDEFNADNPDRVVVKAAYQGNYEDLLAKYTSSVRDQSTPSLLLSSDVTTGLIHDAGQTVSAQSLAKANPGDLDLNDLRPAARNYYTSDGELMSVPFNTSVPLLYVNDAILSKAGVDVSSLTTMAGLDAAARKIHAKLPTVSGFLQPSAGGWWFEQMTAAAGENYCTPGNGRTGDGATALNLSGAGQRSAFATVAKLYTDGVGLDTGAEGSAAIAAFADQKVGMMFNSSSAIGNLAKVGMTGFSALPLPRSANNSKAGPLIGGASMWVNAVGHSAAEQVASWKVVSYLASPTVQEAFSQASGYAPINVKVDDSASEQTFLAKNPAWAVAVKEFKNMAATEATAGCLSGALPGLRTIVLAAMADAYAGKTTLDEAIQKAQTTSAQSIRDYREQAGK